MVRTGLTIWFLQETLERLLVWVRACNTLSLPRLIPPGSDRTIQPWIQSHKEVSKLSSHLRNLLSHRAVVLCWCKPGECSHVQALLCWVAQQPQQQIKYSVVHGTRAGVQHTCDIRSLHPAQPGAAAPPHAPVHCPTSSQEPLLRHLSKEGLQCHFTFWSWGRKSEDFSSATHHMCSAC